MLPKHLARGNLGSILQAVVSAGSADQLPVAICRWHKRDACDKKVCDSLSLCGIATRVCEILRSCTGHEDSTASRLGTGALAEGPGSFQVRRILYASTPEPISHCSFEFQGIASACLSSEAFRKPLSTAHSQSIDC